MRKSIGNRGPTMFDIFLRRRTEAESYGLSLNIPRESLVQMLEAGGLPVLTGGEGETDGDNSRGYGDCVPGKRLMSDRAWLPEAVPL